MASAAQAIEEAACAKPVDESLWWDSFVILLDQLEGAPSSSYSSPYLAKMLRSHRSWFLGSLTCFKAPNASSRDALNSPEISFGQKSLRVKPELREIALLASDSLSLDELQSYILVDRTTAIEHSLSEHQRREILYSVMIQYYLERQCLLKCVRWIFMHVLHIENESDVSGYIREEGLFLVQDGIEKKFLSILNDLSQSTFLQKMEVDFMKLWVEEALIEVNLILDTFFLAYYENFCGCKGEQWKALCKFYKVMIAGPHIGELAESSEAKKSFEHAKIQLALVLIETLDLETLLRMVHDEIPFRSGGIFSLGDIQEMNALVLSIISLQTAEAGPLILSWGVFLQLILSLPDKKEYKPLMATDILGYIHNSSVYEPFVYLMEILQGDFLFNSDSPVSGYLSVLKTFISAFITCFEISDQSEDNTRESILDILCRIYRGEESLCKQFWDRDSFIDKPIRSFLYSLEIDFPYNILVIRLLSALCEGSWPAECVFNFLCNMTCITSSYDIPGGCKTLSSDMTIISPCQLRVEGYDVLCIPNGSQGHVVRIINENTALVRWKVMENSCLLDEYLGENEGLSCGYSGIMVLLSHLAQEFCASSFEDVSLTLDLLSRICRNNPRTCFALMEMDHLSNMPSGQSDADIDTTSRVNLVKLVCSLGTKLMHDEGCTELASLCINILGELLKCSPSYVVEVTLQTKIFGGNFCDHPVGPWFLSGGLANVVLAECEQNMKLSSLTISVLDFTRHLIEVGADNDMVSSLVIFALQYVLVNHENWRYTFRCDRWKVTLKVFELVKSCIRALQDSSKLSVLIQKIFLCDSSVQSMLTRVICIKSQTLEELCTSRLWGSSEVEGLQHCVCSALDAVSSILVALLKDTSSDVPIFIESFLTPTSKPVPVVAATASLISFFHNADVQVAAARFLSLLCAISPRVKQYSSENTFNVLEDAQLKDLSASMKAILYNEETKGEELLVSVMNLLISAARFQPTFLISFLLSLDAESPSSHTKDLAIINPSDSPRNTLLNSLIQYLNKMELLFERSPCLLLGILRLVESLWKGNVQYSHILEKFTSSEKFWKNLTFVGIDSTVDFDTLGEVAEDDDGIAQLSYRYQCEAVVLDIITCDMFLHRDNLQSSAATTNMGGSKPCNSSKVVKHKDVLSKWCVISHLESCSKLYSSSRFPEEIIHRARMEAMLCVVHMLAKLSSGEPGSLSLSLIQQILAVSKKLSDHPAFLSLLQKYSVRGYSEVNELNFLVLGDLYHHINGELEGRDIAPEPFKEVFQFLLEVDPFQKYQCKLDDNDMWPLEKGNYMFDITRLRKEMGIELWEHNTWKSYKPQAERMLSFMHHTNSVKFLAYSKNSCLKALTRLLSIHARDMSECEQGVSEEYIQVSIEQLSRCVQMTKDLHDPVMGPSEESLDFLASQIELILSLFKLLSPTSVTVELLPVLLIKTSDVALRFLGDARQSTKLLKTAKISLTLLLTALESIYPDKADSDDDKYSEIFPLSLGLLPILCKYVENPNLCNLCIAAIDLIIKGLPLISSIWLPILQNHLHLQLIISKLRQKDRLLSLAIILRFLLTLSRLKEGALMLYSANFFQSFKILLSLFNDGLENEELEHIWGLGMAITESMITLGGDDLSCSELVADAIQYFYSEKAFLMNGHLSFPRITLDDDHSKKKARTQKNQISLAYLKQTELALMLTCKLAKHQRVWIHEMREKDQELRERVIHMLAFLSKTTQPLLACLPTLKEEIIDHAKPSFIKSKQGWFTLITNRSRFSDLVSINMYRITFLLLEFLCIQARVAAKRAKEVGYVDFRFFPELPMPEILHGVQDQCISIISEICNADNSRGKSEPDSGLLCCLLLQILEKALYLEFCVSQICGIRPIMGRAEDFSKEVRLLTQAVRGFELLKPLMESLEQIIGLVHPGAI